MTLCEYVMEVAEEQAKKLLHETLVHHICRLSDEIIATAEEIDINENKWNFVRSKSDLRDDKQTSSSKRTELFRDGDGHLDDSASSNDQLDVS
jgi:hypothetical protein